MACGSGKKKIVAIFTGFHLNPCSKSPSFTFTALTPHQVIYLTLLFDMELESSFKGKGRRSSFPLSKPGKQNIEHEVLLMSVSQFTKPVCQQQNTMMLCFHTDLPVFLNTTRVTMMTPSLRNLKSKCL